MKLGGKALSYLKTSWIYLNSDLRIGLYRAKYYCFIRNSPISYETLVKCS